MSEATTATPPKSDSPSGGAASLLAAHKDAARSGPRGGSHGPRGPYRKTRERDAKDGAAAPSAPVAPPAQLFTEDNTRDLVKLPFTFAAVATDFDDWRLDDAEQKKLAATGSVALNQFVSVDPKWVALCLFSLSLISVATHKSILYQAEQRRRAIMRKPQPAPAGPPQPPTPPRPAHSDVRAVPPAFELPKDPPTQ